MIKDSFSKDEIESFLLGRHPMEGIVSIEVGYNDKFASVIYKDSEGVKRIQKDPFKPFVWAKKIGAQKLFVDDRTGKQNRRRLKFQMDKLGLKVKTLKTFDSEGNINSKLANGYNLMFYATRAISYTQFMGFFKSAGVDLYDESRDFLVINRVEQHMMITGKRYFKGFEDYDELIRLSTDLETEGLEPTQHRIKQIGIRTNKGFEIILSLEGKTPEEKDISELDMINGFLRAISLLKPDVITGYNSENFDWNFLIVRSEMLGYDFKDLSTKILNQPIYKSNRGTVLKLGGEMEYFFKTNLFGYNITDALHAVRRSQAMDSNMKKADLKYVTQYSKLNKPNRVYIQGDRINTVLSDEINDYAFNNTDGKWYKITDENPLKDNYEIVTGKYIVERYLLDDIYETDKVELMYNQTNFLISKLLPTSFQRATTMGTAGIWRLIMMAWSIEHNLAIPEFGKAQSFTGGLSRLLEVGYSENVLKLDFNSLYPSIIITWGIESETDVSNVMLMLLEYILTTREESKELKNQFSKKFYETKELLESNPDDKELLSKMKQYDLAVKSNDNKQLQQKVLANSFFGSFGSPNIFPWGDINCAEQTTCTGRQSLRLMVKWFNERGYNAIVGDTDGFNFVMRDIENIKKRKYIGKGLNRNTINGREYTGADADVAEFNDLFMRNKMGLGIDEVIVSNIVLARKNYADLFDYESQKIKLVGNTIKSKSMPLYIEKFIDKGVKLLLNNKGHEFLKYYYDYIERIYNFKIPLREIASKGRVKRTMKEYIEHTKTVTKAGSKKARQAWYELLLRDNVKADIGDTVYYVNTGEKKNDPDVKRVTEYYHVVDNEKVNITKELQKDRKSIVASSGIKMSMNEYIKEHKYKKTFGNIKIIDEDIITLNSILLDKELIESNKDVFCDDTTEYNSIRYIEQFNKRISPLLVCFSPEIRDDILIDNPNDRKEFIESKTKLTSGFPNKPTDQDTYEELMTMEDKEIKFWLSVDKEPPFLDEINMNWEAITEDYKQRMEVLRDEGIVNELEKYDKIINSLTSKQINSFTDEGTVPTQLTSFLDINVPKMKFISKKYGATIGSLYDICDRNIESLNE